MAEILPLFPLGTVLFPGLVLPLHIFEERYRLLVRELLAADEDAREFGVITIRKGREAGTADVPELYDVGCTARLHEVEQYADGRFDLVTVGTTRFRLDGVDTAMPYLRGSVERLPELPGDGADALMAPVTEAFGRYVMAIAETAGGTIELPALPDDPATLSYLVGAAMRIDLAEKQRLLAAPDTAARLQAGLALLRRETTMLKTLPSTPAPELSRTRISPN